MNLSLREKAEKRLERVENSLLTVEQMMDKMRLEGRLWYGRGISHREWDQLAELRTLELKQQGENPEEWDVRHPGCRRKDYKPYGWH